MTPKSHIMNKVRWEWFPFALLVVGVLLLIVFTSESIALKAYLKRGALDETSLNRIVTFLNLSLVLIVIFGAVLLLFSVYLVGLRRSYQRILSILQQGHERYRFFAEGPLSIGIIRLQAETGRVVDANTAALRFFGVPRSGFVGKKLSDFLTDQGKAVMDQAFSRIVEGKKFMEVSCTVKNYLGEVRDVDFHLAVPQELSLNESRTSKEAVAILTDVTERRIAEEERMRRERLQGVIEMAGGAAHELNQPIQVILGYSSILRTGLKEGDPMKDKVERIVQEIERLSEIAQKIASINDYAVRDYVGNVRIIDIHRASNSRRIAQKQKRLWDKGD